MLLVFLQEPTARYKSTSVSLTTRVATVECVRLTETPTSVNVPSASAAPPVLRVSRSDSQ